MQWSSLQVLHLSTVRVLYLSGTQVLRCDTNVQEVGPGVGIDGVKVHVTMQYSDGC